MSPTIASVCLFAFGVMLVIVGACVLSDAYEIPRQPFSEERQPTVSNPVLVWPLKRKTGLVLMWVGVANMLPALLLFWVLAVT